MGGGMGMNPFLMQQMMGGPGMGGMGGMGGFGDARPARERFATQL
jgi:hypothetical protein